MRCPYCRESDDKVVDSRVADEGAAIRRRRECLVCHRRYTTYERVEEIPLVIAKRSGEHEPFNRRKLVAGIDRAVTNRPIDSGTVGAIASEIEEALRLRGSIVPSEAIGFAVMERLLALDQVAYLRYASVYKGFEDLSDFEREVDFLQQGGLEKTTTPKRRPGTSGLS